MMHAAQCDYNFEAYDGDCCCGATWPATIEWAEAEVRAISDQITGLYKRLAVARHRLDDMRAKESGDGE